MLRRKSISIVVLVLFGLLLAFDGYTVIPSWVFAILFFVFSLITICGSFFIQWNYHLTSLHANKTTEKNEIALTFDDGPNPEYTPQVLYLLGQHKAKATFFCIGQHIEKHPELFKRIITEGHSVGNHTYSHSKSFGFFSTKKVTDELNRTIALVKNRTGKQMNLYRPAFGVTNPMIEKAVNQLNIISIGWSVRSLDTTERSETIILDRITSKISKGDVVLLHDTSQKTINVLERLLLFLEEKDLKSVAVDELLQIEAYV